MKCQNTFRIILICLTALFLGLTNVCVTDAMIYFNFIPNSYCSNLPYSFSSINTLTYSVSIVDYSSTFDKFSLWNNGTKLRGANIFQRKVYQEFDGYDSLGPGPVGPPFKQTDFDNLSKAGANFVVLSHPGLYDEKYPYAVNAKIQNNLDSLISMAQKANLYVVIAFRTGPGRSEFTFYRDEVGTWFDSSYLNENIWKDQSAQTAYVSMWKYTANRYKNNPTVIGYEIMVEPNSNSVLGIDDPSNFYPKYENTTFDWNLLALRISKSIRTVDTNTPILIGCLGYSDIYWLSSLKPTGDNRTVYTIHQYEPYTYTFQDIDKKGLLINTYPGSFDVWGYGVIENFNKSWIDNLLKPVDSFKNVAKAPVAVTEYGCFRWEPGADVFMNDQMDLFEARGMNYAIWEWCPSYKSYAILTTSLDFQLGQDINSTSNTDSNLYTGIKNHWGKNIQM